MRSLDQLMQHQAELLAAWRSRRPEGGAGGEPALGRPRPEVLWGKITAIVTADPQFGPHLMVQPQVVSGSPATTAPAAASVIRCFPPPGKVVAGYAVDEFIRLVPAAEAIFAERLA